MDDVEGIQAEIRLREISDQIVALRMFEDIEPGNRFLIELLELERATIKEHFIKAVE